MLTAEQGVCNGTVSVRLPAWAHISKTAVAGLLLWARQARDIDRLLHGSGGRVRAVPRFQRT